MKKMKHLLLMIITCLFLLPFGTVAKEKINIYFFKGDGCPHCEEAEEFFNSIKDEFGKYYNLVDYETWYDKEKADLMKKVAAKLGEEASGVPYIIIGKKTWNGYASSYNDDITSTIKKEFNKKSNDRYDVMKEPNKKDNISSDIVAVLIIVLVTSGIVYGIVTARKKSS